MPNKLHYPTAIDLFTDHYMILFDADSDLSEECLISILAKKHAILTAEYLKNYDKEYFTKLISEIQLI